MEDEEIQEYVEFTSLFFRHDRFQKPRSSSMIEVFPKQKMKWSFTYLSVFLNELVDFAPDHDHPFEQINEKCGVFRFRQKSEDKDTDDFVISVSISNQIFVRVNQSFIFHKWNSEELKFVSNFGAQDYLLKTPIEQMHIRFTIMFTDLSNASKSFLYKRSLLFNSKFDFTKIFHFFAKRVNKIGIAFNDDTEILFNYIYTFCGSKKLNIQSFSDLSNNGVNCYIKIQIQPKVTEKKIQRYVFEDKEYYIISGTFILPQAKSVLENQNIIIDGFLLDTTWRIMPYYVTSILTACFMNTSVPIAYAFGHGETKDLYSFLLKTVESQINVKFKGKVFESDQGPSLKSLFKEWGIIHLFCIRHFFHNLKKFDYFYEMKNIINCATQFELFNCINIFSKHLSEIVDKNPTELTNINKSFKKIGRSYYPSKKH